MSDTWWLDLGDLDAEQSEIIDLEIGKSYVVFGPPGSGKSNLLLLRANFLYLGGYPNIQIIVFTRTLQEFIGSGGAQYDFPLSKVKTSTKFTQRLLYKYGVDVELPNGFAERRRMLLDKTNELIVDKGLSNVYDTILLDEAQDYWPEEIEMFSKLSKHLFAVADSRQKIYLGDDAIKALHAVVDETRTLQYHYRIGKKICKVADALMEDSSFHTPMAPGSQYKEHLNPSRVEPYHLPTLADQAQEIIKSLEVQIKAHPDELLGVLCPTRKIVAEIGEALNKSTLSDLSIIQADSDSITFVPQKPILVSTIHAAKGLEFRTVHIPGAENLARFQHQKNLAFTAITRAKTTVSIYHSEELPGYLAEAVATVQSPKPIPNKKHVFGKNKK